MRVRDALSKVKNAPYALAAAMTVATATNANAEVGLARLEKNLTDQAGSALNILTMAAFVAGAGFLVAGVMKLKQAQDTGGQQVKWSDGGWRVILGGALASVPFLLDVAQEGVSGGEGADDLKADNFGAVFGN